MDLRVPCVELTWSEILFAGEVGLARRVDALRMQREHVLRGRAAASWDGDINGAIAEQSVAKHYDVYWNGTVGQVHLPDVGRVQVRSRVERSHHLTIKQNDKDHEIFVSVLVDLVAAGGRCWLMGWLRAGEAKREKWLRDIPGWGQSWFVPDEALYPMSSLGREQVAKVSFNRDGFEEVDRWLRGEEATRAAR